MEDLNSVLEQLDDVELGDLKAKYVSCCKLFFALTICIDECCTKSSSYNIYTMFESLTKLDEASR